MPATKHKATERRYPVDTLWFRNRLKDIEKTQRGLAKHLKRDPSAISLMLKGERKVQTYEATKIADFLGVPLAEVLERVGIPQSDLLSSSAHHVPVLGTVAEDGAITLQDKQDGRPHDFAARPADAPDDTVAYRFDTALSARSYLDAWLVYALPTEDMKPNIAGRLCVAKTADGSLRLGFMLRALDSRRYRMLSFGNDETETVELEAASPVLWIKT